MHRYVVVFFVAVGAIAASAWVRSQDDPAASALMKAKASYAHRLLDAVVQEDFDVIRDQAFRLKAVAETADWHGSDSAAFVRETEEFLRAADRLFQAAKDEDGDAAALAYMNVTLSCVHCHRHLRSE